MKTKSLFVAVLSLVLGTSLSAQITVNQDGGVRIGTAPKSLVGGGWTLSTKGLETNVGEVKFHLDGGKLIVDGGLVERADVKVFSGGSLELQNGGILRMEGSDVFESEPGAVMLLEEGSIE